MKKSGGEKKFVLSDYSTINRSTSMPIGVMVSTRYMPAAQLLVSIGKVWILHSHVLQGHHELSLCVSHANGNICFLLECNWQLCKSLSRVRMDVTDAYMTLNFFFTHKVNRTVVVSDEEQKSWCPTCLVHRFVRREIESKHCISCCIYGNVVEPESNRCSNRSILDCIRRMLQSSYWTGGTISWYLWYAK